ncbi:predicted protein [Streptomyces sp. SPB78]|nr:predicted protein [Streptomyces sp. SPB78]
MDAAGLTGSAPRRPEQLMPRRRLPRTGAGRVCSGSAGVRRDARVGGTGAVAGRARWPHDLLGGVRRTGDLTGRRGSFRAPRLSSRQTPDRAYLVAGTLAREARSGDSAGAACSVS